MSLSKEKYDKAKKKASARIEKWVQDVQEDQKNGISRLISNYPDALRRIQFDKYPKSSIVYHRPIPDIQAKDFILEEKQDHVFVSRRGKKTCSASAENIPLHTPSAQRKTNSDGSLCEIRIESQKSRFSRRSSRLSVEDPFRLCLWSSRDLNNEPCSSKLSHYDVPKDNECLEVFGKGTENRSKSRNLSAKQNLLAISNVTSGVSRGSLRSPSRRRRKSARRGSRRKSIRPPKSPKPEIIRATTPIPAKWYIEAAPRLVKFFKKIYNIVLLFRCTCRQLSGEFEDDEDVFKIIEDGQVLTFDPREFRASSSGAPLTQRERRALSLKPAQRKKDDVACLFELINRLPLFAKYRRQVKEALAERLQYDRIGAGRVVVKQGQVGSNVYCVVSGVLRCRMSETDPRTGGKIVTSLPDLKEGSTFGELALVKDIKRTATVVCKTSCELLVLTRSDFDEVMRETWEKERQKRLEFLQQSKYFRSWTDDELAEVADVSRVKYYKDNDVVIGNVSGISPIIYFIMSGTCRVTKQLPIVRLKSPYQPSMYQLQHLTSRSQFLDKIYAKAQRRHVLETHTLTITELNDGDYMGVGENLEDIHILAKGKVVCLSMNSVQFEIFAKKKELHDMAVKRQELLPDDISLYRRLMTNMNWSKYKRRVVEEVIGRKKISGRAKWTDVPWSIRMEPRV